MSDFKRKGYLQRLTVCALFAAMLCVVSPIAIPLGPIPISLGLFGVLLCVARQHKLLLYPESAELTEHVLCLGPQSVADFKRAY